MQIPKIIKITSIITGAILALLILVVIIAPFLIDSDTYRKEISQYVKETTGRNLTIGDDIELSVFPWIGFKLGAVTLDNPENFSPKVFASIGQASVRVKLLPLLEQQIEVDKITLHGLVLHLQINEQGISNWDDLVPDASPDAATPDSGQSAATPIAALVIGGIDLRNAHLTWDDQQSKSSYTIDKLNLSSTMIGLNKPFDINVDFSVETPGVRGDIDLKSRITIDLNQQRYRADKLRLKGTLKGADIPNGSMAFQLDSDISTDLNQQTLEISSLRLEGLGLQATGNVQGREILDAPVFEGSIDIPAFQPRELIKALALPPVETTDPGALQSASLQLQFSATGNTLKVTQLSGKLDETTLDATASVKNFASPVIELKAALDVIDMDRYLPPTTEPSPAASPAGAAVAGALDLPVEDLRALALQGNLAIGSAKISGLTVRDFSMQIAARDGLIKLTPIKAALYEGRYDGNVTLDVRKDTPRFSINEKLRGIQAEPLLKDLMEDDMLSGSGDISAKLTSRGNDIDAILKNLNGDAAFVFRDGAVKGVNLAQLIRKAKAVLKNKPLPDEKQQQTDFTELSGTIQIIKGIASNSDLSAQSPYFRISGKGKADLVKQKIDYLLNTKIVGTGIGQTEKDLEDLKGVDIPIRIKGALTDPTYKVDTKFITNLLRSKAEKRLKKTLTKEQDKIIEEVEEQLQDALKNLFR